MLHNVCSFIVICKGDDTVTRCVRSLLTSICPNWDFSRVIVVAPQWPELHSGVAVSTEASCGFPPYLLPQPKATPIRLNCPLRHRIRF